MNGNGKEYKRKNREMQRYTQNSVKFSTNITRAQKISSVATAGCGKEYSAGIMCVLRCLAMQVQKLQCAEETKLA